MNEIKQENTIKTIELDENKLIKGITYIFDDKGLINWRAMADPQYIYVNPSNKARIEKKYGKPYDQINPIEDKVEDSDLIISLAGLRQLLRIRRYKSVEYIIKESNEQYASVTCRIVFSGMYETLNEDVVYSENGCAHLNNTNSFAKNYLLEIASNRAQARCIRAYLGIGLVSREELGGENVEYSQPQEDNNKQAKILKDLLRVKNIHWNIVVDKLKKEGTWDDSYKSPDDLPKNIIFDLISRLKKAQS